MKKNLIICAFMSVFLIVGCATSPQIAPVASGFSEEDAEFAGWAFAKIAPAQAERLRTGCFIVERFATEDAALEYIRRKLAEEGLFGDMSEEEIRITQNFLRKQAKRAGIHIDFKLGIVDTLEGFDVAHMKGVFGAVCRGIRVGLGNS